tara:strand:- start:127 stop:801 length:675 start_codon:yes stop_codon:yes gene_type:complete
MNELLQTNTTFIYSYSESLFNLGIAFIAGIVIGWIYKITHKGLSYSQSFVITTVLVTVVVALVIMVIGNNLARAFALVGALSIIRFRTVVKDTKDTAFIFWALAVGLAAGTSNYFLTIFGTGVIGIIIIILNITNFGTLYKSEFILRYILKKNTSDEHTKIISKLTKNSSLLHAEPTGDGDSVRISLDIILKKNIESTDLVSQLNKLDYISDIVLIASKNDVDY